jgi:hypothetical protein
MLAATLAVAPIYALRFTCRSKTDRATQATTLELVGRAAHDLILHLGLRSVITSPKELARLLGSYSPAGNFFSMLPFSVKREIFEHGPKQNA